MRVLVTGGAGFLGSHVADAYSDAGHDVVLFDRRSSPWRREDQTEIVADLLDREAVDEAVRGVDCVFHLAALADLNGSVNEISQQIVGDYFSTILMVDLSDVESCGAFKAQVESLGREGDYKVVVQHERIFRAMHRL